MHQLREQSWIGQVLDSHEAGPLKLLEKIGSGSFSEVYKASSSDDQLYTVKILDPQKLEGVDFKSEIKLLALLHHHAIQKIYEFNDSGEYPFLVLSHFKGESLRRKIDREGSVNEQQIFLIVEKIASAMDEIHRKKIVHRDIKAENVLIDAACNVSLIDFGLSGQKEDETSQQIVGSFHYTSPEQARILKRPVDNRSDLYSLGILIFYCVTGRLPFEADHIPQLLEKHAREAVPSFESLDVKVSPFLSCLVKKLLAKDPDDRYQSAVGLLYDIRNRGKWVKCEYEREIEPFLDSQIYSSSMSFHSNLVGREQEYEDLEQVWEGLKDEEACSVFIEGLPGGGKSRLVWELIKNKIYTKNVMVLHGKSLESNRTPLHLVKQLFDNLVHQLSHEKKGHLLEQILVNRHKIDVHNLYQFSPKFFESFSGEVEDVSESSDATEAVATLFRICSGFFDKSLIFIDDVQWIDASSRTIIEKMLRDFGEQRSSLFVFSSRNDPKSLENMNSFLEMQNVFCKLHLKLEKLDQTSSISLIKEMMGGHQIEKHLQEWILDRSQGNPFSISEYIRAIVSSDDLKYIWGKWEISEQQLFQVQVPQDIISLVASRIRRISKECQTLLRACSLDGGFVDFETLGHVFGLNVSEVYDRISEAISENIIEYRGKDKYTFIHDRVIEAVQKEIQPQEARDIHVRFSKYLSTIDSYTNKHLYRTASHFMRGDPRTDLEKCYQICFEASKSAIRESAYVEADRFLEFLNNLHQEQNVFPDVLGFDFLFQYAFVKYRLQKPKEALKYCFQSLEFSTDDKVSIAEIYEMISKIYLSEGQAQKAYDATVKGFQYLDDPYSNSVIINILFGIKSLFLAIIFPRGDVSFERSQEDIRYDELMIKLNTSLFHSGYYGLNTGLIFSSQFRNLDFLRTRGSLKDLALLYGTMSITLAVAGQKSLSFKIVNKALKLAKKSDDRSVICEVKNYIMVGLDVLGMPLDSLRKSLDSLAEMRRWLAPVNLLDSLSIRTQINYGRGYPKVALQDFESFSRDLSSMQNGVAKPYFNMLKSVILCMLGDFKAASKLSYGKDALEESLKPSMLLHAMYMCNRMLMVLFTNGSLEELRLVHEKWKKIGLTPSVCFHQAKYYYLARSHAYFDKCLEYEMENKEIPKDIYLDFMDSLKDFRSSKAAGLFQSHMAYIEACHAYLKKNDDDFFKHIHTAERYAEEFDVIWVTASCLRLKALRCRRLKQNKSSLYWIEMCQTLCLKSNIGFLSNRIKQDFSEYFYESRMSHSGSNYSSSVKMKGLDSSSVSQTSYTMFENIRVFRNEKYLESLLKVSIAASKAMNLDDSMSLVLYEVIQVVGAERGFIVVFQNQDNEDSYKMYGQNSSGELIGEEDKPSQTVLRKVTDNRKTVLVEAFDQDEVITGAESVVINDIKSIVAVPIILGENLLGVLYLDSSIVKGVFSREDVGVLSAISSHIGVAIESLRSAQIELERREAIKDLEVTGMAQKLLLPDQKDLETEHFYMKSYFKPATQSGGDWWWRHKCSDGSLVHIVADVTGHGPGPAMMTALVAGVYQSVVQLMPDDLVLRIEEIMKIFHESIHNVAKNQYWMSMSVIVVNPHTMTMEAWSAGAPPIVLLAADKTSKIYRMPSSPLGGDELSIGSSGKVLLHTGDKIVSFTDGVYEIGLESPRPMSLGRFQKIMMSWDPSLDLGQIHDRILRFIEEHQDKGPQHDDITFSLIEVKECNEKQKVS